MGRINKEFNLAGFSVKQKKFHRPAFVRGTNGKEFQKTVKRPESNAWLCRGVAG